MDEYLKNTNRYLMLFLFFLIGSGMVFADDIPSIKVESHKNPANMFIGLYEKYKNTTIERKTLSELSEGAGMYIYDIDKTIDKDLFCRIMLFSSLGQTQYLIYKNYGEDIWYFHKQAIFYDVPFELENAEIINTYFKYSDNLPYAYNERTGEFDIQADTSQYLALRDFSSLLQIIEIIQENVKNNGF